MLTLTKTDLVFADGGIREAEAEQDLVVCRPVSDLLRERQVLHVAPGEG